MLNFDHSTVKHGHSIHSKWLPPVEMDRKGEENKNGRAAPPFCKFLDPPLVVDNFGIDWAVQVRWQHNSMFQNVSNACNGTHVIITTLVIVRDITISTVCGVWAYILKPNLWHMRTWPLTQNWVTRLPPYFVALLLRNRRCHRNHVVPPRSTEDLQLHMLTLK